MENMVIVTSALHRTLTAPMKKTHSAWSPHSELRARARGAGRPGPTRSPGGAASRKTADTAENEQNVARFRLYRHRFLQENMRFAPRAARGF